MRNILWVLTAVLGAVLSACSKTPEPPPAPKLQPEQTLFKEQVRDLEKAKAVDATLQQDAQRTREAIDKEDGAAR